MDSNMFLPFYINQNICNKWKYFQPSVICVVQSGGLQSGLILDESWAEVPVFEDGT